MKSEAEFKAEIEKLQAEIPLLIDLPVSSQEATEWVKKVLIIKEALNRPNTSNN